VVANKKRPEQNNDKIVFVRENLYKIPYRRKNGLPANRYFVKTNCSVCGKEIYVDRANFKKSKKSICSIECRRILSSAPDGAKKNKRGRKELDGHILIKQINHPFAKKGWVPEHRYVVEKNIGRYLESDEIVHHINMDKKDNRIENLHVFKTNTEHFLSHGTLNKCVKKLIEDGIICFDKKQGAYLCI
jgi:hypothetical protein